MNKDNLIIALDHYMQNFKDSLNSQVELYSLIESAFIDKEIFFEKIREVALENYKFTNDFVVNVGQFKKVYMECIHNKVKSEYDSLVDEGYISVENAVTMMTQKGKKELKIHKNTQNN